MDYLKKHKANLMRAALIVVLLQFFTLFMPFAINDELEFSYWLFLLVATIAFLILAYFIGEHDKTKEKKEVTVDISTKIEWLSKRIELNELEKDYIRFTIKKAVTEAVKEIQNEDS